MSTARKARGMRTQLLTAQHLAENGWPHAESTGSGRSGVDILGAPGLSIEVKARKDLAPLEWVKQAEGNGGLPVVVFRPNGMGEHPGQFLTMLRLDDLIGVLRAAGFGEPVAAETPDANQSQGRSQVGSCA